MAVGNVDEIAAGLAVVGAGCTVVLMWRGIGQDWWGRRGGDGGRMQFTGGPESAERLRAWAKKVDAGTALSLRGNKLIFWQLREDGRGVERNEIPVGAWLVLSNKRFSVERDQERKSA
jgi:hypothetical protein